MTGVASRAASAAGYKRGEPSGVSRRVQAWRAERRQPPGTSVASRAASAAGYKRGEPSGVSRRGQALTPRLTALGSPVVPIVLTGGGHAGTLLHRPCRP